MIDKNKLPCCSVKGCNRPVRYIKHQLCNAHAQRFYRHGDPGIAAIHTKRKREPFKGMEKKL